MDGRFEGLISMALLAIAVAGCQPTNSQSGILPKPTAEAGSTEAPVPRQPTPETAVTEATMQPGALSIQNPYAPVAADESLVQGSVYVDSVQWNPDQAALVFKGSLPTPCNQLRLNFLPLTADRRLHVHAYSVAKPDELCAQVIQEFEGAVTLAGLAPGDYTLFVNDQDMLRFSKAAGILATPAATSPP